MRTDLIIDEKNPYRTLDIRRWATAQEIKHAYIRMVKRYNPEIYPDQFIIVRRAYDQLRTPERRAKVDLDLFNQLPGNIGYKHITKGTDSLVKLNRQIRKIEELSDGKPVAGEALGELLDLKRQRSLVYAEKKMWREALSEWNEIYSLDKTDRQSRRNLVIAYANLGYQHAVNERLKEAIAHWEEILKRHPASVEVLHNMAIAYTRLGEKDLEKEYWRKTLSGWNARLRKDPENPYLKSLIVEAHKFFGGELLGDRKLPDLSSSDVPRAMGDDTTPPTSTATTKVSAGQGKMFDSYGTSKELGVACMDRQNWEGAIKAFQKCLEQKPDDVVVLNHLGWAYLNSGNHDRAFLMWNKALKYDPKNKETRDNICLGNAKIGKQMQKERIYNQALVHFKRILQMQPDNAQVYWDIGQTYLLKGDKSSAIENWQKALKLDPKNRNIRNAIRKAKQLLR